MAREEPRKREREPENQVGQKIRVGSLKLCEIPIYANLMIHTVKAPYASRELFQCNHCPESSNFGTVFNSTEPGEKGLYMVARY